MTHAARAVANANIALAKYWGKTDTELNLPAVPSLSLTLDGLRTTTRVEFDDALATDQLLLDGKELSGRPLQRASRMLDEIRTAAGLTAHARIESLNDFPTAAGLASSASGFAALAVAAARAADLDWSRAALSRMARRASASAARSLFGGFVTLAAGDSEAEQLAPEDHWPLRLMVTVTSIEPKAIGSTEGMQHTSATSPYYASWIEAAPQIYAAVREAVISRDIHRLGEAAEHSALAMHACMLAARPALVYLTPTTLRVLERVRKMRKDGLVAYATMDAGPHVKVLSLAEQAAIVSHSLTTVEGVVRVISCSPGPGARVVVDDGPLGAKA